MAEVSKPVLIASGVAAASLVVAAVAVGYAVGAGDDPSPAAQPTEAATPDGTPTPSPSAKGLASCLEGLDKTPEGRQAMGRAGAYGGLPDEEECVLVDETVIALKRIANYDGLSELATPLGVYYVWANLHTSCLNMEANGGPNAMLDELAKLYERKGGVIDGDDLDDDLAAVATSAYYAVLEGPCPEYQSDMRRWLKDHTLPWLVTVDGYE